MVPLLGAGHVKCISADETLLPAAITGGGPADATLHRGLIIPSFIDGNLTRSQIVRTGIRALGAMTSGAFGEAVEQIDPLKPGRKPNS